MQKKKNLGNLPKTIDCWVEIGKDGTYWGTMHHKPSKKELKNNKEFGYKTYKATIVLIDELK